MHSIPIRTGGRLLFVLALFATPASAQWTQVPEVPASDVFSVSASDDTILACAASTVYVSTDGGATWHPSAQVAAGINSVNTALVHDGRLFAGTDQQGVFVSDDLGGTWAGFNTGLSGLGSLDIAKLMVRGDSLYAATVGAGAWVRDLDTGNWIHFGDEIDADQAGNMTSIAAGGSRLLATGGFNGDVFFRDPGQADWTESLLFNDHLAAGLAPLSAIWTGSLWVVGSNIGLFQSATGQEPWTFVDFGLSPVLFAGLATHGPHVFASLGTGAGTLIVTSPDAGASWQGLDTLASVFVYELATHGSMLFAGRVDGLWRRSIPDVAAVPVPSARTRLSLAIAGPQPVGDRVRFSIELPAAGPIALEVFDVMGRRVGEAVRESRPAGHGDIAWDAASLEPGVYHARLTAAGEAAVARVIRVAGGS